FPTPLDCLDESEVVMRLVEFGIGIERGANFAFRAGHISTAHQERAQVQMRVRRSRIDRQRSAKLRRLCARVALALPSNPPRAPDLRFIDRRLQRLGQMTDSRVGLTAFERRFALPVMKSGLVAFECGDPFTKALDGRRLRRPSGPGSV